ELALQRWRGDESLPLLKQAANVSEEAGEAQHAASAYARTVEVSARMGGVSGCLPIDELEGMMRRARELVPDEDTATRARLLLDEAWIAWRFGREHEMAEPTRAGLELARSTDDVPLLSSALDAMCAVAWGEARYDDAIEHSRERLELLADPSGGGAQIGIERSDALHMMIESLVASGQLRSAAEYADQARELDLSVGTVYSGWARGLLPAFFLGEWDSALEMADGVREAWAASDRPPIAALGAALACAGAVLGYRGDDEGSEDWFRFASSVTSEVGGQRSGVSMLQADVALHRGRVADAVELVDEPVAPTMWWRSSYAATKAEVLIRAGAGQVAELTRDAEQSVGDHRYARGVLLRAAGVAGQDERRVRESLAVFSEMECPYQAARTGWAMGGAERAEAERTFERLGATLPAR
ncbi:MAG: hypothetical protein ACRDLL_15205, partial [Solirubrobacterales bacterium]